MKLRIVCPGRIKEKWIVDGINEYVKRISRFCRVEIIEVADSPDSIPADKAIKKEGELILSKVSDSDILWVMDLHGKLLTSEELSSNMVEAFTKGGSQLTIAIGGSRGIDQSVLDRSSLRVCLGKITLTHQMTRVILLEQVYRGFKIANNENYHK